MVSSLFKLFKMNAKKETDGVDVAFPPNADGSVPTFRVSRKARTNINYAKVVEAETRPYRRQIEMDALDNPTAERIQRRVFVDSILLGWENVQDENGVLIPFNRENAMDLLTKLPELHDVLESEASKAANFRDSAIEADAKN